MPDPYPLSAAQNLFTPKPVTFATTPPTVRHVPKSPPPPPRPPAEAAAPCERPRRRRDRPRVHAATLSDTDVQQLVRLARAILYAVCITGSALILLTGMGLYHVCRLESHPGRGRSGRSASRR